DFALEGSVFIAGAAIQWLRDSLHIIRTAADIEALAASVPDSGGVTFIPAFTGLGAPHWDPHARGTIFGLTRGTTAAHIARAALRVARSGAGSDQARESVACCRGKPRRPKRCQGTALQNAAALVFLDFFESFHRSAERLIFTLEPVEASVHRIEVRKHLIS